MTPSAIDLLGHLHGHHDLYLDHLSDYGATTAEADAAVITDKGSSRDSS